MSAFSAWLSAMVKAATPPPFTTIAHWASLYQQREDALYWVITTPKEREEMREEAEAAAFMDELRKEKE